MIVCGFTFESFLFTLYSLSRYILRNEDFFLVTFLLQISICIFYLSIILVVIYWTNLLKKEVWDYGKIIEQKRNIMDSALTWTRKTWICSLCNWHFFQFVFLFGSGKTFCMDCAWYNKLLWWPRHCIAGMNSQTSISYAEKNSLFLFKNWILMISLNFQNISVVAVTTTTDYGVAILYISAIETTLPICFLCIFRFWLVFVVQSK